MTVDIKRIDRRRWILCMRNMEKSSFLVDTDILE